MAFVLSFGNHLIVCLSIFYLARALGVTPAMASLRDFFVLAPVANIVGALPLLPGGWGLGELAYKKLFELIGASGALGVAVSVVFRLTSQFGLGAIGALFLLFPGVREEVRDVRD